MNLPAPIQKLLSLIKKTGNRKAATKHSTDSLTIEINKNGSVVTINGIPWATDLYWMAPEDKGATLSSIRNELKNQDKFDKYSVFNNYQGVASNPSLTPEHKKGMHLLAAGVMKMVGTLSALIVIKLADDHYYFLACKNNEVMTGLDTIYSASEARSKYFDNIGEFREVTNCAFIFPDTWDMAVANKDTRPPLTFLPRSTSGTPYLHLIKGPSKKPYYIAGLAGLAFIGAGYSIFRQYQKANNAEYQKIKTDIASTEQATLQIQQEPIFPVMPSKGAFRATEAVKNCLTAIPSLPIYPPGWTPTTISCDGQTITENFLRDDIGTINWLSTYMKNYRNGTGIIKYSPATPRNASVSWTLPTKSLPVWPFRDGQHPTRIMRYLISNMEEIYQGGSKNYLLEAPQNENVQTKTVKGTPVTVVAPWTVQNLTINEPDVIRDDITNILGRIQNLVLTNLTYNLVKQEWKIQYKIYHYTPPTDTLTVIKNRHTNNRNH